MFKKVALGVIGVVSIVWGSASIGSGVSGLKKSSDHKK